MNIKKQLVNNTVISTRTYGRGNTCEYITIHETANTNKGANAQAHANLQSNMNPRQASWHYTVDDKQVIQSFDDNVQCWAAGDGKGSGNTRSIHIEMCVNSDGNWNKTVDNTVELVKHLMKKHNIPISRVVQHATWSGKDCPKNLRTGKNWDRFKEKITSKEVEKVYDVNKEYPPKYYYVQAGAFSSKKNAEALADKLHKAGFPSFIKYE